MFWSKLWFSLVAFAAALAVVAALLSPRPLARDLETEAGARLERAQHGASLLLKVNARNWMDAAAVVATDAALIESLEQATRGPADLALLHRTVQERLRYFNDKMKVDMVLATDAKGRVIARAGLDGNTYKDGVEGFPLVADALRGLRGDDTWSLDGKLFRMAASPVIARDRYVGALVVGQEVGVELAQSMKQVLDLDVAFVLRGRVLAASSQVPILPRLPPLVDQEIASFGGAGHSLPIRVDSPEQPYLVVLAPFVGEASAHKAAYVLISPRPAAPTVESLLTQLLASDLHALPWGALAPIFGALLGVILFGLLLMRVEAERPLKRLAKDAQALARGELQRLDDDRHPGRLGTVARAVNSALDRLGTRPAKSDGSPRAQPAPKDAPAAGGSPADKAFRSTQDLRAHDGRRDAPPRPPQAGGFATGPSKALLTPPTAPGPKRANAPDPGPVTPMANGPDLVDASGLDLPPLISPMGSGSSLPPLPPRTNFTDDDPTRATDGLGPPGAVAALAPASPEEQALESEIQEVYSDFLETKQRLGEPTDSVSFDRFASKLRSNREALIVRYACKSIKFQVYVKDGKAALKATPIHS